MKKLFLLLFLAGTFIGTFAAHGQSATECFYTPERVVVTGKAKNLRPGTTALEIVLFRPDLGNGSETMLVPVDGDGNFRVESETYGPVTFSIRTPTMLSLHLFPGESTHAEFDATTRNPQKFHESLIITGDRSRYNLDVEAFYRLFLPDPVLMDYGRIFGAMKTHTPDQFLVFLDSLQVAGDALYDRFVETCDPTDEAKIFARTNVDMRYPDFLGQYIMAYEMNNVNYGKVELPADFADRMLGVLPLSEDMLLYGSSVDTYTNRIHSEYVLPKMLEFQRNQDNLKDVAIALKDLPQEVQQIWMDSLLTRKMVELTPDPLLKQLVLMEDMQWAFLNAVAGIRHYENNVALLDEVITLPYLRKPLHEFYLATKMRLENPVLHTGAILRQMDGSSVGEIVRSILDENRGKLVYIDVWATWCGPCKSEMPYSNKLMQDMEGRDVVFVYLCVDSDEQTWKADLDKMQMTGLQYYLDKEQSTALRQAFEINGIPEYLLFDRTGTLAARGLRPSDERTKAKFEELLK